MQDYFGFSLMYQFDLIGSNIIHLFCVGTLIHFLKCQFSNERWKRQPKETKRRNMIDNRTDYRHNINKHKVKGINAKSTRIDLLLPPSN